MGSLSIWHVVIVVVVVVLLFGRGRISGVMGDLAQGIKSFKRGMSEDQAKTGDAPKPLTVDAKAETVKDGSAATKS
ncbi:MAG: twin-arginine translocase TatA/TatE family subunit [Alphaproteobacteria bacterium]|nr:twin-arginine translocase TatA/TatE family subunit [Alphaproteobacteria bacterium]